MIGKNVAKKIIKKVGMPQGVSQGWFDKLVENSMMLPAVLRRLERLEEKVRNLEPHKMRILVWRNTGGLGDIIMQSVIARELKKAYPDSYVVFQVPEKYLAIPQRNKHVDEAQIANTPFMDEGYEKVIKLSDPCPASMYEIKRKDITKTRIDLFLKAAGIKTDDNPTTLPSKARRKGMG